LLFIIFYKNLKIIQFRAKNTDMYKDMFKENLKKEAIYSLVNPSNLTLYWRSKQSKKLKY
jgi:hypothetical protein